ncbi:helix-turn-helix transcriptional regulator [Rhizobium leguminosarum]|uniref:helix-turn-helix domain-containing protein n=1 Tax=Rhizobium TaxID=379 RepID=UPI001C977584|nr:MULTISPECIES: helix-turn-helix transcriptional regulator [Rhizobium]MBY5565952.1 helix-turn-helix transcriptional regulator [Rhizobium leguminosarum]MBY5573068.1 helix-turn-helix transcriptional regulator [Rhizobium leguminosarum]UFW64450.1 helix-turn-helix transcriptional regulator [Rhizobium laguerreae]
MKEQFHNEAFFNALDAHRYAKDLTWKAVAEKAEVSASTLTRIAQGKRPDVDTLAALCRWSGLSANDFINYDDDGHNTPEPLAEIVAHLRADKNLKPEGAQAIEVMLKAAYAQFRKEKQVGSE